MVQVRRETNEWFSGIRTAVFKPSPLLKDEPVTGLACSGISKPRRISAFSGPAAGGRYLLPERQKVKIRQRPRRRVTASHQIGDCKVRGGWDLTTFFAVLFGWLD